MRSFVKGGAIHRHGRELRVGSEPRGRLGSVIWDEFTVGDPGAEAQHAVGYLGLEFRKGRLEIGEMISARKQGLTRALETLHQSWRRHRQRRESKKRGETEEFPWGQSSRHVQKTTKEAMKVLTDVWRVKGWGYLEPTLEPPTQAGVLGITQPQL